MAVVAGYAGGLGGGAGAPGGWAAGSRLRQFRCPVRSVLAFGRSREFRQSDQSCQSDRARHTAI